MSPTIETVAKALTHKGCKYIRVDCIAEAIRLVARNLEKEDRLGMVEVREVSDLLRELANGFEEAVAK